jgi:hypothetical protein
MADFTERDDDVAKVGASADIRESALSHLHEVMARREDACVAREAEVEAAEAAGRLLMDAVEEREVAAGVRESGGGWGGERGGDGEAAVDRRRRRARGGGSGGAAERRERGAGRAGRSADTAGGGWWIVTTPATSPSLTAFSTLVC